jgi:hypothetical protein
MARTLFTFAPVLAVAFGLASPVAAQTADKVLAQQVAALGGTKALKSQATVEYRGEARDEATGDRGSFTLTIHTPNLIYLEFAGSAHGWSEADNGKSAWRRDAEQSARTLTGAESKQLRALGAFLNSHFVDYKKGKWSATYQGTAAVDGHNSDVIEMANSASELAGAKCKFYFDSATHMLLKQEQEDDRGARSIVFSDYRPVGGVPEPYHLTLRQGAQSLDVTLSKVARDAAFVSGLFDYPGAALTEPPDMGKLFADLNKHQDDLNKLRRTYSCIIDETSQEIDGQGKVTKTTDERFYAFYLGEHQFRKLIAKNGVPVSDKELQKEDERIAKEQPKVEERQKKDDERRKQAKAKRAAEAAKSTANDSETASDDDEDTDSIRTILKVMRFFNFRREPFRGHEVLVFDFGPKPDYKPHGLVESLISKFIGTMWVDEKDHQVVRVQARSSGSFKIGGGLLASLEAGSSIVVEQEKVNGEVWMPVYEEGHISARILLLKSAKANETARYSDYKKFTVGSKVTFGDVVK